MVSPEEFMLLLGRAAAKVKLELVVPTETVMTVIALEAKDAIGTYDFGWPQLSPFTQADRASRGFSPNEPLKRTGELQESVVGEAEIAAYGAVGVVGSADPVAVFHEFGTKNMPARAIFSTAMLRGIEEVGSKVYAEFAHEILSFRP
jgi:hypothetical protein